MGFNLYIFHTPPHLHTLIYNTEYIKFNHITVFVITQAMCLKLKLTSGIPLPMYFIYCLRMSQEKFQQQFSSLKSENRLKTPQTIRLQIIFCRCILCMVVLYQDLNVKPFYIRYKRRFPLAYILAQKLRSEIYQMKFKPVL